MVSRQPMAEAMSSRVAQLAIIDTLVSCCAFRNSRRPSRTCNQALAFCL